MLVRIDTKPLYLDQTTAIVNSIPSLLNDFQEYLMGVLSMNDFLQRLGRDAFKACWQEWKAQNNSTASSPYDM